MNDWQEQLYKLFRGKSYLNGSKALSVSVGRLSTCKS